MNDKSFAFGIVLFMKKHEIFEGQVFGYLTVVSETRKELKNGKTERAAICNCICGKEVVVILTNLVRGTSKSCDCMARYGSTNIKHGLTKHPLFSIWSGLKDRTKNDPNYKYYKYYYGKGVRLCKEWEEFKPFYDWAISNGWEEGLQLDKDMIPEKLGIPATSYSPEMCCFITSIENGNHKINSFFVEYKGEKITVSQLARKVGISISSLRYRISDKKMSVEGAIEETIRKYRKRNINK